MLFVVASPLCVCQVVTDTFTDTNKDTDTC